MKKNTLLIILTLLLFNTSTFANNLADSLLTEINNYGNKDTAYVLLVEAYCKAQSLTLTEPDYQLIKSTLQYSTDKNYIYGEALMLSQMGWYNYHISQFKESIFYLQKAVDILETLNDQNTLLEANTNLANTYNATKDFEKALAINLKSIRIVENHPNTQHKARYYFYTGKTYDRLKNYNQAEAYYLKAKKISEDANFPIGVTLSNSSLGHNYIMQKQYNKAIPLLKSALNVYIEANQQINVAGCYNTLASAYQSLNNYNEAAKYFNLAITAYEKIDNISYLKFSYRELAKLHGKNKQYNKAIEAYKMALEYSDSLYAEERTKAIEEVKIEYETEKYKQQKVLAEANEQLANAKANRNKIISLIIGFFSIVSLVLLVFIFNRMRLIRKQKQQLNNAYAQLEESKKNELAVSNLKALQSQMNPHFIFNALNSVQDLVLLKDIRNSNKFLGKFSDLIRKILLSSKEQFISLEEEIEILTLYLDLEKLRFGDEFIVEFNCSVSQQKQAEIELPAMFIQPYIENAIKHGLFHKQGKKILKVDFSLVNSNKLQCIIEDNGVGQKQAAIFKEKRLHLHTGFSTEAINERIRLLNQTLNKKIDLQTIDLEANGNALGTKVILHFPISRK